MEFQLFEIFDPDLFGASSSSSYKPSPETPTGRFIMTLGGEPIPTKLTRFSKRTSWLHKCPTGDGGYLFSSKSKELLYHPRLVNLDYKYRWPEGFSIIVNRLLNYRHYKSINILACSPEKDSNNIFAYDGCHILILRYTLESCSFTCEFYVLDLQIVKMTPCNSEGIFAITKDGLVYHVKIGGCDAVEGLEGWFVLDYDNKTESFLVKKRDEKVESHPSKIDISVECDQCMPIFHTREVFDKGNEEYYEDDDCKHNEKLKKLFRWWSV